MRDSHREERRDVETPWRTFCIFVLAVLCSAPTFAQTYPPKPIRCIIAFPPGGSNDIFARIVGGHPAERMGTGVVVDNRPGGGANISSCWNSIRHAESLNATRFRITSRNARSGMAYL
jgi:tripartite-type tricarboxylate transporter receptor subunit TctC